MLYAVVIIISDDRARVVDRGWRGDAGRIRIVQVGVRVDLQIQTNIKKKEMSGIRRFRELGSLHDDAERPAYPNA